MVRVLREMSPFDPEHLPLAIELIEALARRHPKLPQLACFDTAFHRHMPRVARMLPIPRNYEAKGMLRYGFHRVSYEYLMGKSSRLRERKPAWEGSSWPTWGTAPPIGAPAR
jgi:acetate kinase